MGSGENHNNALGIKLMLFGIALMSFDLQWCQVGAGLFYLIAIAHVLGLALVIIGACSIRTEERK